MMLAVSQTILWELILAEKTISVKLNLIVFNGIAFK